MIFCLWKRARNQSNMWFSCLLLINVVPGRVLPQPAGSVAHHLPGCLRGEHFWQAQLAVSHQSQAHRGHVGLFRGLMSSAQDSAFAPCDEAPGEIFLCRGAIAVPVQQKAPFRIMFFPKMTKTGHIPKRSVLMLIVPFSPVHQISL